MENYTLPTAVAGEMKCGRCQASLPLDPIEGTFKDARWQCAECGEPMVGKAVKRFRSELAEAVRLHHSVFGTDGLPALPRDLCEEVLNATRHERNYFGDNKRRGDRVSQDLEAPVRPLLNDFTPVGSAFNAFIYNLSPTGLALVSRSEPVGQLLAISLGPPGAGSVQMIGRVVRCSRFGASYFKAGVQFRFRLGRDKSLGPKSRPHRLHAATL